MSFLQRTTNCGTLNKEDVGQTVILNGWVHRIREHGALVFINLRDRYGITQVVVDETSGLGIHESAKGLKLEYCIGVRGVVRERPPNMINESMATGFIEVLVQEIELFSKCDTPPFMISDESEAKEDLKLKYRFLDLRSQGMQNRIALRHKVALETRKYLANEGFYEIETPTLMKSTPEGARDYLVPSRLYPGKCYALPQSPQLYKQLLMISGFDKYFQIARCYRDEDLRGDRQPEFTQIDIEMSFVSMEDVLALSEGLFCHIFLETLGIELPQHFPRLTYKDAMARFGTDKPDTRFGMELFDFSWIIQRSQFAALKSVIEQGGSVNALIVPDAANLSRKQIDELEATAKIYRAKGLAFLKIGEGFELTGSAAKMFEGLGKELCNYYHANPNDLILFAGDQNTRIAQQSLGAVRLKLGKDLNLCPKDAFAFVWVLDFPLFEYNEELGKWDPAHHPFTMPSKDTIHTMEADPGSAKGELYDLVLNGVELASGSIRIHDPDLQRSMFKIMGMTDEDATNRFGFFLEAMKYGAPPHGGIAPGLDRLIMVMSRKTSIKDVIAFPKNSFAVNPMDESPGDFSQEQLKELKIQFTESDKG